MVQLSDICPNQMPMSTSCFWHLSSTKHIQKKSKFAGYSEKSRTSEYVMLSERFQFSRKSFKNSRHSSTACLRGNIIPQQQASGTRPVESSRLMNPQKKSAVSLVLPLTRNHKEVISAQRDRFRWKNRYLLHKMGSQQLPNKQSKASNHALLFKKTKSWCKVAILASKSQRTLRPWEIKFWSS